MTFGFFLIFLGLLILLKYLGYLRGGTGDIIVPLLVIFVGGSMIIKGIFGNDSTKGER